MKPENPGLSIEQVRSQYLGKSPSATPARSADTPSFRSVLEQASGKREVHFSKHAEQRLGNRNIELTPDQKDRLNTAAQQADEKGIRDSLVLVDSLAFIVNVPSRTVITALDQNEAQNNIFTNIDGAVIA